MTFDEALDQVRELLRQRGRATYRSLKLRYQLDDELLAGVTDELISAERVAVDEDGKVLVWIGNSSLASRVQRVASEEQGQTSPAQTLDPRHQTLDSAAERRQLTVLFCDLVGSTTLSAQLDPEELRAVVQAYQQTCAAVIRRYEGHIAQYLGDGVLVYFGYPLAHEDDAQRAVRTGLEIITALAKQVPSPLVGEGQGEGEKELRRLQVRIGIHTGLVVIGDMGSSEKRAILALGETPNIAARLQGLAEPDTVIVSAATQRLVAGLFECQDLGPQTLKGLSTSMAVYQVVREGEAHSRFEAAVSKGLTPLVGREEELGLLRQRWEQAKTGSGQVVLLSGEPGIGKSRLVQELKEHVGAQGAARIEFRCSPYHQNSAFYPIIDHLQRLLQFAREDSPAVKLEKLQHLLSQYRFPQADMLPLLAALLSLPHPEDFPPITVSPQKQKEKTQAALLAWLIEEAEKAAVLCAWEDLHWADPSTLEVLTLLLDQAPTTRLLALLTFRPEFIPPWGNRSHLSQLTLSRLGRTQVEAMVEKVTGENVLPPEVVQQIVAKTDGVPLFIEELTKSVVESVGAHDRAPLQAIDIPASLQDSLMARLDRLNTAKEIAQVGATIGREFSYELLHAVSSLDEGSLQQGLQQLVEAELVYQRGLLPSARYLFKHALIQDTAYQSLLKSRRQQLHQQVAQALAEQLPGTVETQPELLAHHYTEAGLTAQAIPYWQQAGQKATQRSANAEAIAYLTKGLDLLKSLPDTVERTQQELSLQVVLAGPVMVTKGMGALEAKSIYDRALELCRQVGEAPQLFEALFALSVYYMMRAEHHTALQLSEQLLRIADNLQDPTELAWAHHGLGVNLWHMGDLVQAFRRQQYGLRFYKSQARHSYPPGWPDPGVVCLNYMALALWGLGYPDQALQNIDEALTLAERLAHPFSVAYALTGVAGLHTLRRESQAAQKHAEALLTLCVEQGFLQFTAYGLIYRGGALVELGQVEEGISQMQEALSLFRATGTELGRTGYLMMPAAAYAKIGKLEQGFSLLIEAFELVDQTGAHVNEASLYVLKGWFLLARSKDNHQEAEVCFLKAV